MYGSAASTSVGILVIVAGITLCIFWSIIGLVCVYKFLQMSEDVRYLRHRSDSSVKKPMEAARVILICLAVSAGLALVFIVYGIGGMSGLTHAVSGPHAAANAFAVFAR
jgi:hypothetical protein